jgi:hypothetical protein
MIKQISFIPKSNIHLKSGVMKKSLEYLGIALICVALIGLLTWLGVNFAKLVIDASSLKTERAKSEMPAKSNAYDQDRNQESRPDSLDYFIKTSRNDGKRP